MTQPYNIGPTCYRHPNVEAAIFCQRCGKPICPQCMNDAPVGFQCPECVKAGAQSTRKIVGSFGGAVSHNPRTTSFVIMGINVAIWLVIMVTGGARSMITQWMWLTTDGRCYTQGGFYPGATSALCQARGLTWVPGVLDGGVWQLITSAFTHISFMHLAMNMLSLFFLGPIVEQALGRARFLAIYLGSALAGSALVLWLSDPLGSTLGASGAIFGLIGALAILAWKTHGDVRNVLMWLGINLVFTFMNPGISWQGHIGGLLGGLALTAAFVLTPRSENRARQQWMYYAGALALITFMIVARAFITL